MCWNCNLDCVIHKCPDWETKHKGGQSQCVEKTVKSSRVAPLAKSVVMASPVAPVSLPEGANNALPPKELIER